MGGGETLSRAELTSFVGRQHELTEITQLLSEHRLLTLTGPGGIGKTRLAIRAASQLAKEYASGVRTVYGNVVVEPHLLTAAMFSAFGIDGRACNWQQSVLIDYMREKQVLLVLDECEHMLDASRALVLSLLRECPHLNVIATSRQPLGVDGEARFRVRPLAIPDHPGQVRAPQVALSFHSVQLFLERAKAVDPLFLLDEDNCGAIVDLCCRLDGIPLALELAAARIDAYSVDQILEGLNDQAHLSTTGHPDSDRGDRILRRTIDKSFELLSEEEKLLWTRLAVFSGDFGIDSAVFVCGRDQLVGTDMRRALGSLVDKSMVIRHPGQGDVRYRLLEPMRRYASEELHHRREGAELELRLVQMFADLAQETKSPHRQSKSFERVHLERASLRTVLAICQRERKYAPLGLTILYDLSLYFQNRGSLADARQTVESLLALVAPDSTALAKGLCAAGEFALVLRDVAAAEVYLVESLRIARLLADPEVVGWCLFQLAAVAWEVGERETEADYIEQMIQLGRAMGNDFHQMIALQRLGLSRVERGDVVGGLELVDEALAISISLEEEHFRSLGLWNIAVGRMMLGELGPAEEAGRQALHLAVDLGSGQTLGMSLECLAWIAAERRDGLKAARLLGAASEMWKSMGSTLFPQLATYHDRCEDYVQIALGESGAADEQRAGARLSRSEIIQLATSDSPGRLDKPVRRWLPTNTVPTDLTRREIEVARLVASGLASKEAAAELRISTRTVEAHVGHILAKLGLKSRVQLANWVASQDSLQDEDRSIE